MKTSKFALAALIAFITTGTAANAASYKKNSDGEYCREFNKTINVGGKKEQGYGTACLQPDGSWKVVADDDIDSPDEDYYASDDDDDDSYYYSAPVIEREEYVFIDSGRHYPPYHKRGWGNRWERNYGDRYHWDRHHHYHGHHWR